MILVLCYVPGTQLTAGAQQTQGMRSGFHCGGNEIAFDKQGLCEQEEIEVT